MWVYQCFFNRVSILVLYAVNKSVAFALPDTIAEFLTLLVGRHSERPLVSPLGSCGRTSVIITVRPVSFLREIKDCNWLSSKFFGFKGVVNTFLKFYVFISFFLAVPGFNPFAYICLCLAVLKCELCYCKTADIMFIRVTGIIIIIFVVGKMNIFMYLTRICICEMLPL